MAKLNMYADLKHEAVELLQLAAIYADDGATETALAKTIAALEVLRRTNVAKQLLFGKVRSKRARAS